MLDYWLGWWFRYRYTHPTVKIMPGIIIAKLQGKINQSVFNRLRNLARILAEDGIALFLQKRESYLKPKIHFEITDAGFMTGAHMRLLAEEIFIKNKGKGIGDTEVALKYGDQSFVFPDDAMNCVKAFDK